MHCRGSCPARELDLVTCIHLLMSDLLLAWSSCYYLLVLKARPTNPSMITFSTCTPYVRNIESSAADSGGGGGGVLSSVTFQSSFFKGLVSLSFRLLFCFMLLMLARAPYVVLFNLKPLIEDGNLQVYRRRFN